jgi:hypothetical protein
MTVDELNVRLENLSAGEVEVLTRAQFDQAFRALSTLAEKKMAAITLGDWRRCGVIFVGADRAFVSFTRRSARPSIPPFIADAAPGDMPASL